jgi:hypothetical protein
MMRSAAPHPRTNSARFRMPASVSGWRSIIFSNESSRIARFC